jgi:prepilin-type N-terminal cleavage/methylation domain-containing protein
MTAASSPCGRTAWIWKGRAGSPLPAARRQSGVGSIANARRRAGDCPPYPPGATYYVRSGFPIQNSKFNIQSFRRAFTVLEMLVVITIIGFMAALALPHLPGMTRANSMTAALQQMMADCALARQLAVSHRTTVYMVFVPPNFPADGAPVNELGSYNNLLAHQYGAYALASLRSVGDQPGQANPQYLTEWKPLPDGVFIAPFKFAGPGPVPVSAINTLSGTRNTFVILPFPNNLSFPFPAADAVGPGATPFKIPLPYIGFSPLGQLTTNNDEYIPLDRGSVFYVTNTVAATPNEAPPGNATNNCNIIHIDWLTARAKIERNQQQ